MNVLAVIDMQNDFIDGVLGTDEAQKIVDSVKSKIDHYRQSGDIILFTQDTHSESYLKTQEGQKLPVEHCIKGTNGWQISSKLAVEGAEVVEKPSFGSFDLAEKIAQIKELETIELIGLCTDICVISNAIILKAKFPEVKILVDASCCAGVTVESHQNAINAMKMCQIEVIGEQ